MNGTFAVTTGEDYQTIPYHKASSFRINNYTGKLVGIRPRHNTINLDDFEDLDNPEWTGDIITGFAAPGLDGNYGAKVKTLCHRKLTDQIMLDGSEVEVKFDVPDVPNYTIRVLISDTVDRIQLTTAPEFNESSMSLAPGTHRVIFRLFPSVGKYDLFVEYGGKRNTLLANEDATFGTNDMVNSLVALQASHETVFDSVVYQQKVNYSNEILHGSSSVNFPCVDNISEYEVINLGSDVLNYSDNTDNISLSGFYES